VHDEGVETPRIYRVSPGTLYPLLHVFQRNRLYRATKKGHEALNFAKDKVREVFGGTNRDTVMRRRPIVNCRPSDTPAGNPVARNLPNHDSASMMAPMPSWACRGRSETTTCPDPAGSLVRF